MKICSEFSIVFADAVKTVKIKPEKTKTIQFKNLIDVFSSTQRIRYTVVLTDDNRQTYSCGFVIESEFINRETTGKNSIKNRLNAEIALFSKRETEIIEALEWVNKAITQIGSKGFKREQNTTVFQSIQKSLKNKAGFKTEVLIHKLQTYVLAEDLYTLSNNSFGVAKSALLHYYAIEDSAISAKEHEALLQRGLETLAVYHAGGITQEEINSILQAAQAVALGVISAGVL